ncbi:MAG: hypothetical protein GYB66_15930, partial [Chloroflexi bacterium]|nr:hypothetical protein [Chloroflexota bacterium]
MITIPAKDIDIEIDASAWRIYEQSERLLPKLLVELLKGSNILEYHSDFGQPRGLPGNKLGIDYVRAIVAGYDPKGKCWRLGLHVSNRPEDDPRWVELAQWPPGPNQKFASEAQQAGRALAELVGCPLKVFGVKKLAESRPTGPLEDHQRKVINLNDVFRVVRDLKLPVTFEGVELAEGRGGNTVLRTSRQYDENQAGKITPGYRQCEIDSKKR